MERGGAVGGIAIVTGASRGIGAACARLLGGEGYAVCVNYRGEREAAERVVAAVDAEDISLLVVNDEAPGLLFFCRYKS